MALHQVLYQREADAESLTGPLGRLVHLHEQVPHLQELVLCNADTVVADLDQHVRALVHGGDLDTPARLGVLHRVQDQVLEDLLQSNPVCHHRQRLGGQADHHLMAADLERALAGFERVANFGGDVDGLAAQFDDAAGDARDVQEILDQPRHLRHLPVHGLEQGLGALRLDRVDAQHMKCGAHRRERIAQFVGERGEELVLPPVGVLDLLVEEAVVERRRGAPCEAVGERQIGTGETPRRGAQRQQESAAGLAAGHQREGVDLARGSVVRGVRIGRHCKPGAAGMLAGRDHAILLAREHRLE